MIHIPVLSITKIATTIKNISAKELILGHTEIKNILWGVNL